MSHFVSGYGNDHSGYDLINIDRVARLRVAAREGKRVMAYDCYDGGGDLLGRVSAYDIHKGSSTIIPNHSGSRLVEFYWNPATNRIDFVRSAIIAWLIQADGETNPLGCWGQVSDASTWCIEERTDTTQYIFPHDCTCDTFDAALKHAETYVKPPAEQKVG